MTGNARPIGSRAMILAAALAACSGPSAPPPEPADPPVVEPTAPPVTTAPEDADSQQTLVLKNGITAHLRTSPVGSDTQIQLGLFAGSSLVAPGLATLTAHVFVESSDSTTGRPSMRQQIESIGGNVNIQVGLMTSWLDIRVPTNMTDKALQILRSTLESSTQSRTQIERMRSDLIDRLTTKITAEPVHVIARALLQGEQATDSYLNALLDLDPSEVSLFQSRQYRPETSLLAISAPQPLAETLQTIQEPAETSISGWQPPPPAPGQSKVLDRPYTSGLYWVQTPGNPGPVRAAIMMRLPDASMQGAAEWLMMHACLTLDGTGGRLEQMQDEAHLPELQWETHIEQTADAQALVLSTTTTTEVAGALWTILNRARQSLVDVPPTTSELDLALRRTYLNATLPTLSGAARLRLSAKMALLGDTTHKLTMRAQELVDPSKWDLAAAAAKFQETPAWMIVVGTSPPPDLPGVFTFEHLPRGFVARSTDNSPAETNPATASWLEKARAALGGEQEFQRLIGFHATATRTAYLAPPITDEIKWKNPDSLTRRRKVMGQEITTEVNPSNQTESLNKVKASLSARETRLLRHEMMRHPLMLLKAHASGTLHFRTIAQRKSGDREFIVLEALGGEFDRLRIHIDTESFLIRIVESWERLSDETLVHLHETWSDYRAAGVMRAPFRRRTMWDDGKHQTETIFSEWLPTHGKKD